MTWPVGLLSALATPLAGDQPVEVTVVEGGTDFAPFVIGGAALFAAIFAGYWQWRQLRHDRELRDREHLRELISSVAESIPETTEKIASLQIEAKKLEAAHRAAEEDPSPESQEERVDAAREEAEAYVEASQALRGQMANNFRMRFVLREESPIVLKHLAFLKHLEALHESTQPEREELYRADEKLKAEDELSGGINSALVAFQEACRSHFV